MNSVRLLWASSCCLLLTLASPAHAQKQVTYVADTVIEKDLQVVSDALLAYGQWCDKGCKYKSPGVVVDEKLPDQAAPQRFFTWTWIRDVKDTKYFSEITVQRGAEYTNIKSRALTKAEKSQIEKLEKSTGRKQDALFDTSLNLIQLKVAKDANGKVIGTHVRFDTRLEVSGFLELFPGKLRKGLKESTEAVFAALRK